MNPNSPALQALKRIRLVEEERHPHFSMFYRPSLERDPMFPDGGEKAYYDHATLDPSGTLLAWQEDYGLYVAQLAPEPRYILSDSRFGRGISLYYLKLYTHCVIALLTDDEGDHYLQYLGLPYDDVLVDEKVITIGEMVALRDDILYHCDYFDEETIQETGTPEIRRIALPDLDRLPTVPPEEAGDILKKLIPLRELYTLQSE